MIIQDYSYRLKCLLFILFGMIFHGYSFAQFEGGNGDGHEKSGSVQSTLNGAQINAAPLYYGGSGDGTDKALFSGSVSGQSTNVLFLGGPGDGFNKEQFSGTVNGTDLSALYTGGNGDGFDKDQFNGSIDGTDLTALYGGGDGDGFDKDQFNGTTDGTDLAILFSGGNGDGFDKDQFNGLIDGTDLTALYGGGDGDGFDKDQFDGIIDGTDLAILYGGGTGDGFDKSPFSGPLAIDPPDPPLPVELLHFAAYPQGKDVQIEWETAIEIDNDYFIIQRSPDTREIEDWAFVPGKGNGFGHRYTDLDINPLNGVSYYRLVQVDFDDTRTTTDWIAVRFDETQGLEFSIFPNPSPDGQATLSISVPQDINEIEIQVFDMWGRQLLDYTTQSSGNERMNVPIRMNRFISGNYRVKLKMGNLQGSLNWLVIQP